MIKMKPFIEVKGNLEEHFGEMRMAAENVPLPQALNRVLSQDVIAAAYIPNFDRSAVDGYAVIIDDLKDCSPTSPAILKMIGSVKMGSPTDFSIKRGQCAYVPTGGKVPNGTEAMVMREETKDLGDGFIQFERSYAVKLNLILRGEDMKPGTIVEPAGKRLKIADIGTLAAMGLLTVPVMKRPRVALISTGDELVPATEPVLQIGQIRDVNSPMLYQAILANGGEPQLYGIVKDDYNVIRSSILTAIANCDLLLISGGTSIDEKDILADILSEVGKVFVHGIRIKPGKPTILASIQGKPVMGMPGNPVSAYFIFHLLVRPLLASLQGTTVVERKVTLPLSRTFIPNQERDEYVPIIVKDGSAQPVNSKSGLITTVSCADGFICIPYNLKEVKKGELVEVTLLEQ